MPPDPHVPSPLPLASKVSVTVTNKDKDKKKMKKPRQSAPKSRGGCRTCKARHVKCDELRPACKRCTRAGRECEGYPQEESEDSPGLTAGDLEKVVERSREPEILPKAAHDVSVPPNLRVKLASATPQEMRFLEYFHHRTIGQISGYFDQEFYSRFLLHAGQYESSIRYAMMACGALHEHFEFQVVPAIKGRTGGVLAPPRPAFAFSAYNKAISGVVKMLSSGNSSVESVAMCCLLFVCIEYLRGDPKSAAAHLRSGGSILSSWHSRYRRLNDSAELPFDTPESLDPNFVEKRLIPVFDRLGSHVGSASRVTSTEFNELSRDDIETHEPVPTVFDDIEAARNTLLRVAAFAAGCLKSLVQNKYAGTITEHQMGALAKIQQKMLDWDLSFTKFLVSTDEETRNSRRALVLWVNRKTYAVAIATSTSTTQTTFDEYMDEFRFIVEGGEQLYKLAPPPVPLGDPDLSTFSFEEGVTGAAYYVAQKCRDPELRRRAVTLLRSGPARQSIWNAVLYVRVSERLIELEENHKLRSPNPPRLSPHLAPDLIDPTLLGSELPLTPSSMDGNSFDTAVNHLHKMAMTNRVGSMQGARSIPEEARIHLADIRESPTGSPHHHEVIFFKKPYGIDADWEVWTESFTL